MYVACACLYTVCRTMESPHMLIDFSEVIKANVFMIGAVFLQFIKITNIRLPLNDPSLYIHRFVGQLKFGEQTPRIANSSLRLSTPVFTKWIEITSECAKCSLSSRLVRGQAVSGRALTRLLLQSKSGS